MAPTTEIDEGTLIPVIVTVSEVTSVDSPTPACVGNENGSGVVSASWAEQLALDPPPLPGHVQFHGPLPDTVTVLLPTQRFVAGAAVKMPPLALPHAPLTTFAAATVVELKLAQ